jgi:putative flippase GtrA
MKRFLEKLVEIVDSVVSRLNKIFPPTLVQFGIYAGIGVLGAVWDIGVFALMYKVFGIWYLVSFLLGKTLGISHNFILNITFNFKSKDRLLKRFVSFFGIGSVGIGVGFLAMYIAVSMLHFDAIISNIVSTFFIAVTQFLLNKKISFKK